MNLQVFVEETLKQLIAAVKNSQKFAKDNNARVIPDNAGTEHALSGHPVNNVEFDVAITVTEESETKGGLGVAIATFAIGSTGQTSNANSTISRIKFTLPIGWPLD
jgi:hypothetical protein